MKISKLNIGEIILAVGLAIVAAIGAHMFLNAPKANITFDFRYEHHGEDLKPPASSVSKATK